MSISNGTVGVGIIGFGTVGQGAFQILQENADSIARQVGCRVNCVAVADIRADQIRDKVPEGVKVYSDAAELIKNDSVDIICELIGGVSPAGKFVQQALDAGKHVVTANKELIAKQGPELLKLAQDRKCDFFFEASVGGGIPIIAPLRSGLAGNEIERIIGIVNGTTNYILTRMASEGGSMSDVLKEAQALGYAETDPTNDVEGFDARYKLTILASLGFHARVEVDQILCEGITGIMPQDVDYARELGYQLKLLAVGKRVNGRIEVRVHPTLVPIAHPIASVSGVNNAIFVTGNMVGDVMFYGPGAGGLAAGSAVVGDVVEIGRNMACGATGRLKATEFVDVPVVPMDEIIARYYVRMRLKDTPGVLAAIASEFGDQQVSIAAVIQKDTSDGYAEIIFLTHEVQERNFKTALSRIESLDVVSEICSFIRVEE